MKTNQPMTIETLAQQMHEGFERTDKKFDALTEIMMDRFDKVEERFDRLEGRVCHLETDMQEVKVTLDEHGRKLDEHGRKLDEHGRKLDEHGRILEKHTQTLHQIEGNTDMLIDDDMKHEKRIKKLERAIKPAII